MSLNFGKALDIILEGGSVDKNGITLANVDGVRVVDSNLIFQVHSENKHSKFSKLFANPEEAVRVFFEQLRIVEEKNDHDKRTKKQDRKLPQLPTKSEAK